MLAKIQAKIVGNQLKGCYPELKIEYHTATTNADRNKEMSIAQSDSTGLFTKDISEKIISKKYDIAIHSWKDLPIEPSKKTKIIGTVARGDLRDILILKRDTTTSKKKDEITILSSSPRRKHNLEMSLSKLVPFQFDRLLFIDVRGNIETRLKKFVQGNSDGIVMAKVAIDRILESDDKEAKDLIKQLLSENKWLILPLSIFPTAPGQAAIGIEARNDRRDLKELVRKINRKDVFVNVMKEKSILSEYGGGCQQKIGVSIFSRNGNNIFSMKGQTEQGENIDKYDFVDMPPEEDSRNIPKEKLYPLGSDKNLFRRSRILNYDKINKLESSFIYLSRKNVLDNECKIKGNNYIWTSGLKCWHHASKMGYWINGSSDSLGNNHSRDIKNFLPDNILHYNLSHSKADSEGYELIPTYELELNKTSLENLQIKGKKYFYWMSPIQFDTVLELYPEIINAHHSSGFGKTYDYLRTKLPNPDNIKCFLSYEHWISYYKKREI